MCLTRVSVDLSLFQLYEDSLRVYSWTRYLQFTLFAIVAVSLNRTGFVLGALANHPWPASTSY